ncbi:duf625 domain protein [Moniliophthora roreri]|nr:duf625 domain protein [Moniliophthora roreri]
MCLSVWPCSLILRIKALQSVYVKSGSLRWMNGGLMSAKGGLYEKKLSTLLPPYDSQIRSVAPGVSFHGAQWNYIQHHPRWPSPV